MDDPNCDRHAIPPPLHVEVVDQHKSDKASSGPPSWPPCHSAQQGNVSFLPAETIEFSKKRASRPDADVAEPRPGCDGGVRYGRTKWRSDARPAVPGIARWRRSSAAYPVVRGVPRPEPLEVVAPGPAGPSAGVLSPGARDGHARRVALRKAPTSRRDRASKRASVSGLICGEADFGPHLLWRSRI